MVSWSDTDIAHRRGHQLTMSVVLAVVVVEVAMVLVAVLAT